MKDNGIHFTSAENGILFDIFGNGRLWRVSWVISPDAYWLAVDRNEDGRINTGSELFGTATRLLNGQRASHGYEALAEFDFNNDGKISSSDPEFGRLVLWRRSIGSPQDQAPDVLMGLSKAGIVEIDLNIQETGKTDRWGNRYRYRARVTLTGGRMRWSYDVFLVVKPLVQSDSIKKR